MSTIATPSQILTSAAMFGSGLLSPGVLVEFLSVQRNEFQIGLAGMAFLQETKEYPKTEEDMERGFAILLIMQNNLRRSIEGAVVSSATVNNVNRRIQRNTINKIAKEHREANKPHELGTVAEIAQKYDMSKSEVRRLKNSGQLEAHIQQLEKEA